MVSVIEASQPLSVGELARATGLHQSTTSRLLASLERYGLVERDRPRGRVRVGSGLAGLVRSGVSRQSLLDAARPVLDDIGRATQETVNLAVPVRGGVDHIAQVDAPHFLTSTNWIGRIVPLHCGSVGKVFLAFGAATLGDGPLEGFTPATITDRDRLADELAVVRRRGFATLVDELEPGLRAVATPVMDGRGEVVAALAVSGPSVRLPKARLYQHADVLLQASSVLSARLGSPVPSDEGDAPSIGFRS